MSDLSGHTLYCGMARASVCGSINKVCIHDTDLNVQAKTVKLGTHTSLKD